MDRVGNGLKVVSEGKCVLSGDEGTSVSSSSTERAILINT